MSLLEFKDDQEELEFLRENVGRLIKSQGRTTADDSYSLDYAWDMLEEYVEQHLSYSE